LLLTMGGSAAKIVGEQLNQSKFSRAEEVAAHFRSFLESTSNRHELLGEPYKVAASGVEFVRMDYKQAIGERTNYFCTAVAITNGYAVRFSAISSSRDVMQDVCATIKTFSFGDLH